MFDPATWGSVFQAHLNSMAHSGFWVGVAQIIWVDIILAGDNAVVIALACRNLPQRQRMWGILLGTGVAVLLRVIFTVTVTELMLLSYVKIIGGVALFYIALKLLMNGEEHHDASNVRASRNLWQAVRTVAIADVVMSLDNVLGIAAAADSHGDARIGLIIFGLLVSIPLVVAGAQLVMQLLTRFPVLVWFGGALLGWIAGQVIATDPVVKGLLRPEWHHNVEMGAAAAGALLVLGVAWWRQHVLPPQQHAAKQPGQD